MRPSLSRAFSAPEDRPAAETDPAAPRDRAEAVERLFRALRHELARAGAHEGAAEPAEPLEGARLGPVRVCLEGSEFTLDSAAGSYRFLYPPGVVIEVQRRGTEGPVAVASIGVLREGAGWRPVQRPITPGRSRYRLSSAREIAESYLLSLECPGAQDAVPEALGEPWREPPRDAESV